MKTVHCPCEDIEAGADDELVQKVQEHVREDHPELDVDDFTREKVLEMAHAH